MIAAPLHQLTIWETIENRGKGRPSGRPWGCPLTIWRAACKRVERKMAKDVFEALPSVAVSSLRRPWPISIGCARQEARKVIVRPAEDCTNGFRRLVVEGKIPGMTWESGVGVIRWVHGHLDMKGKLCA